MPAVSMVRPPYTTVIRVPEAHVSEYEDRGWQVVEGSQPATSSSKPKKKAAAKKAPAKKAADKASSPPSATTED